MRYSGFYKFIFVAAVLLLISACTAINTKVGGFFNLDTDLELVFKVDADINPDDSNTPAPLFVRMYELKSTKMFNKANFIDIFERDKEVLGADMIAKQKLKRLKPGEDRKNDFVLNKKTRFVALYAEFLQYKDAEYKVIIPIVPHDVIGTTAIIHVSGNTINDMERKETEAESENERSQVEKSIKKFKKRISD